MGQDLNPQPLRCRNLWTLHPFRPTFQPAAFSMGSQLGLLRRITCCVSYDASVLCLWYLGVMVGVTGLVPPACLAPWHVISPRLGVDAPGPADGWRDTRVNAFPPHADTSSNTVLPRSRSVQIYWLLCSSQLYLSWLCPVPAGWGGTRTEYSLRQTPYNHEEKMAETKLAPPIQIQVTLGATCPVLALVNPCSCHFYSP